MVPVHWRSPVLLPAYDQPVTTFLPGTGCSTDLLIAEYDVTFRQCGDAYSDYDLRQALRNTKVVSSDVNPGIHPTWPAVWEAAPTIHYIGLGVTGY